MKEVNIIELLKEKKFIKKLDKKIIRELVIIINTIGAIKEKDGKYYFNNEECNISFLENQLIIDVNISRTIRIIIENEAIQIDAQQRNKSNISEIFITIVPNSYLFYEQIKCNSNNAIVERKGLEITRDRENGTNIEYFQKIKDIRICKKENNQENDLPIFLVGISKIDEIDEKLLTKKKLILFKN